MRLRWGALVVAVLAGPLASDVRASGTEVEGFGFRGRTPGGWRADGSEDEVDSSVRTFHLDVPGAGGLELNFASHTQNDAELAKTAMQISRGLDLVEAKMEVPDAEPRVTEARVSGADEAYEVVAVGFESTWRNLFARKGKLFVAVTLSAPAGAEEQAEEAWQLATSSLRVEEPSLHFGTIVLWLLGFLVLVAVLVTLAKRRPRGAALPRAVPAPAPRPEAFHPVPAPEIPAHEAAPARPRGAGYSRADDGLPVFTPELKAAVADGDDRTDAAMWPVTARSAPTAPPPLPRAASVPPPLPAAPARTPNLSPPKPVVRIVKGYNGAPTSP